MQDQSRRRKNRRDSERLDGLFHRLWSHPCFTIGRVQGVALGGGAGLVACLDHVIAEPNTKIALSEVKLGILPAVIGPYVYRRLGSANFRRLSMLAGKIDSKEALRVGFIDQLVHSESSLATASVEVAEEILTSAPTAVSRVKDLTARLDNWDGTDEALRSWTLDLTSENEGVCRRPRGTVSVSRKKGSELEKTLKIVEVYP